MTQQSRTEELELDLIDFDPELQVRAESNQETIHEYYEAMATEEDVKKFPPPTVYFDGCRYWLADGHHRYWAVKRRGYEKMPVKVFDGTKDDALLAAVKLNSKNGLRFNDDDWEKIIPLIAGKDQWKNWTNRRLAEELGCSEFAIRKYRPDESVAIAIATEKRMGKDGKMYKAKKNKKPKSQAVSAEPVSVTETTSNESPPVNESTASNEPPKVEVATPIEPSSTDEATTTTPDVMQQGDAIAKAKAGEERIFDMVSALSQQITEWFDSAPSELHDDFAERLRKRIGEMIN